MAARRFVGMPYEITQWSKKTCATCVAAVFAAGIWRVNLEDWSVVTMACWFLCVVRGSAPMMYMATKSNGSYGGETCIVRFCF